MERNLAALKNPKREAFAQARAKGLAPKPAHAEAGYASGWRAAALADSDEVKARVTEILDHLAWGGSRDLGGLIDELRDAFRAAVKLNTGAGMVAARGLATEAARLKQMLPKEEKETDWTRWRGLTEAQWTFLYGPNAAQNAKLIESSTVNRGP